MNYDHLQPPESLDCSHSLCDYCGECHVQSCELCEETCLTARMVEYCNAKMKEHAENNFCFTFYYYLRSGFQQEAEASNIDPFFNRAICSSRIETIENVKNISVIYDDLKREIHGH